MRIERAEHPMYLSNAYLVVDDDGKGVLIDGHGEAAALLEFIDSGGIDIQAVLLTHHHGDHTQIEEYERFGVPVYASQGAADLLGGGVDRTIADGETVEFGGLRIQAIPTPGHAAGHLALLVNDSDVFTADVLFKGTIGGSRAPGNTGFDDLRASVEKLMELPPDTRVHPGHKEPTTIGDERDGNVFVRAFRGEEEELGEPVRVGGEQAELLIWGPGLRRDQQGVGPISGRIAGRRRRIPGRTRVIGTREARVHHSGAGRARSPRAAGPTMAATRSRPSPSRRRPTAAPSRPSPIRRRPPTRSSPRAASRRSIKSPTTARCWRTRRRRRRLSACA